MALISGTVEELGKLGKWLYSAVPGVPRGTEVEQIIVREVQEMLPQAGRRFVRIAGLSGVLAVGLGAYGAHGFKETADPQAKLVFETGNRYHLMHTLALLAVPLTNRPQLVGTLMVSGMILFSGSCYYLALTGKTTVRKVTPYGGMLLMAAWLAIAL